VDESQLEPLDDADLDTLAELLARFAANHLDQWEIVRLSLPGSDVDVIFGPATDGEVTTIWPRP